MHVASLIAVSLALIRELVRSAFVSRTDCPVNCICRFVGLFINAYGYGNAVALCRSRARKMEIIRIIEKIVDRVYLSREDDVTFDTVNGKVDRGHDNFLIT